MVARRRVNNIANAMIRRVSTKPIIKTTFRPLDQDDKSVVFCWFHIEARGTKLTSQPAPAQVQQHGKLFKALRERPFWSDELIARLAEAVERNKEAFVAMVAHTAKLRYLFGTNESMHPEMYLLSLREEKDHSELIQTSIADTRAHLESVEKEMTTSEFLEFFNTVVLPLEGQEPNGERSYALYRGTVWSCVRELEPQQWSLLADRFLEREAMELAAALAGGEPSETRERIPTEVRRAVWVRDQGKCARCGSRERLELDHIVPVSRGGSNTERNIELLCEVCNRATSDAIL